MFHHLLFIITAVAAFQMEPILEGMTNTWLADFPIIAGVALLWCINTSVRLRIVIAITTGIVLDALSPFPFGAHAVSMAIAALITVALEHTISRSEPETYIAVGWAVAFLAYSAAMMTLAAEIPDVVPGNTAIPFGSAAIQTVVLAVAMPILLFMAVRLFRRMRPQIRVLPRT